MLIQAKISGPDTLLKLYVAIDEDLTALQPSQRTPREAGGLLGWAVSKTASCG